MMKFLKNLVLVLAAIAGAFLAVGAFLERCAKAVQSGQKQEEPKQETPKKRPCEEAICAVDQCMPF